MRRFIRKFGLLKSFAAVVMCSSAVIMLKKFEVPAIANPKISTTPNLPLYCPQKRHVLFLKTHKTGGSAVQNIFFRFAFKNNLIVAIPKTGHMLNYAKSIDFDEILPASNCANSTKKFDLMSSHALFNYDLMAPKLHPDTIFVTILRDPAKTTESYFNYFNLQKRFEINFEKFLENPTFQMREKPGSVLRNIQSFDLGLQGKDFDRPKSIDRFIDKIDEIFHLVLIQDFFLESLVLLRELLCWPLEAMVTFSKNSRNESVVESLTDKKIDAIYKWSLADFRLFVHFKSRFMQKIRKYGKEKMAKDVEKLKNFIKKAENRCQISEMRMQKGIDGRIAAFQKDTKVIKPSEKMMNDEDCLLLAMTEPPFTKELRKIQSQRLANETC